MPGYRMEGLDAEREARYHQRARLEAEVRQAILRGEKVYPYRPAESPKAAAR
jgi:hypothetical protein